MAVEVWSFPVTIPAGTTKAAKFSAPLQMPPRTVDELDVLIPPGPRGMMGFSLGAAGTSILPQTPGQWIVTDNEIIHWPLSGQFDSGSWELFGYNLGQFDHTVTVRFLVSVPAVPASAAAFAPIPGSDLANPEYVTVEPSALDAEAV